MDDFKQLAHWSEQSPERTKAVQRMLHFVRGWESAVAHAKRAVPEDSWPRMFSLDSGMTALFACTRGKVDMSKIVGEIWICL